MYKKLVFDVSFIINGKIVLKEWVRATSIIDAEEIAYDMVKIELKTKEE
jgi:hypothetical protein